MKKLRKIVLGAGILLLVVGVGGAGLTYRDIRTENLLHANMATIRIPFTDTLAAVPTGFLPYREGLYTIYLTVAVSDTTDLVPAYGCPPDSVLTTLVNYRGVVDILISDPDDRVVLKRSISGGAAPTNVNRENGWILVDTLSISPGDLQWTLGTHVRRDDSPPPSCGVEVFLLPPQHYDIGTYLADGIMLLVGFGGCMLIGFVMIVLAGRARR